MTIPGPNWSVKLTLPSCLPTGLSSAGSFNEGAGFVGADFSIQIGGLDCYGTRGKMRLLVLTKN
jgi:hypothetical protein